MGQINLIAIHGKNLGLGVVPLDLKSQERFLNFSAHVTIGAVQKERAGKLHGDGAGAFNYAVGQNIFPGRAGNARVKSTPQ